MLSIAFLILIPVLFIYFLVFYFLRSKKKSHLSWTEVTIRVVMFGSLFTLLYTLFDFHVLKNSDIFWACSDWCWIENQILYHYVFIVFKTSVIIQLLYMLFKSKDISWDSHNNGVQSESILKFIIGVLIAQIVFTSLPVDAVLSSFMSGFNYLVFLFNSLYVATLLLSVYFWKHNKWLFTKISLLIWALLIIFSYSILNYLITISW